MKFCGENKQQKSEWFDPLGANAQGQQGPTGGPEERAEIFGHLQDTYGKSNEASGRAIQATQTGAASPMWGQAQRTLSDNITGANLAPNPYLTDYLNESRGAADARMGATREQAMADLESQQAATRATSERNGVSFGTGAQQAHDAQQAALQAALGRGEQQASADMQAGEAAQLAENYARERGLQTSSTAGVPQITSGQSEMLQALPAQYYGPLTQAAEIVRGLASGGQAIQPTMYREPGVFDYGTQLLSAAGSASGGY